jgi:hypothetical protein
LIGKLPNGVIKISGTKLMRLWYNLIEGEQGFMLLVNWYRVNLYQIISNFSKPQKMQTTISKLPENTKALTEL